MFHASSDYLVSSTAQAYYSNAVRWKSAVKDSLSDRAASNPLLFSPTFLNDFKEACAETSLSALGPPPDDFCARLRHDILEEINDFALSFAPGDGHADGPPRKLPRHEVPDQVQASTQ